MTQPTIEQMLAFLDNTILQVEDDSYAMNHLQNIRAYIEQSASRTLPHNAAMAARGGAMAAAEISSKIRSLPMEHCMGKILPTKEHQNFRNEVVALLKKYGGKLDGKDFLALSAHLVGQIIAMQDQRKVSRELAIEIVSANIEQGNQEVIQQVKDSAGSA